MTRMGSRAGSIFSAVFMLLFSLVWIATTASMPTGNGMPFGLIKIMFILFGILFMALAVFMLVKALRMGTVKQEITGIPREEPREEPVSYGLGYCPKCGSPLESDYDFCRACGRRIK